MHAIQTRVYRNGTIEAEGFPVCDVSDHLADDGTVVWVDYCAPTKADIVELAEELGLHELAVEDALSPHQRPKLDTYESHLFLSTHSVRMSVDTGELAVTEIDAFVNKRWLITVRKDDGFSLDAVLQRWNRSGELAEHGTAFLLYGLLDVVVDGFLDTVQTLDDFYDEVSDGIFSEHPLDPTEQRHWFQMRRALVKVHRLVGPLREAVTGLMRRGSPTVPEDMYPYYQDVYDHVLRATEAADALRDLVSTIVETNLSLRDYRQNQVMKKVTSWAAIIAVPTLVTGFYGMNVPYAGSGERWGVVVAIVLMLTLSSLLYLQFRKRDWL